MSDVVFEPGSTSGVRVVRLAPGIALANQLADAGGKPGGNLAPAEWQSVVDRVTTYFDTIRSVPSGARLLDRIPHLLSPVAGATWRSAPNGARSDVQAVIRVTAKTTGVAGLDMRSSVDGAGAGSLVALSRELWEGGEARAFVHAEHPRPFSPIPAQIIEHELFHVAQFLAGANPPEDLIMVPTPLYENWSIPLVPTTEFVGAMVSPKELFAHGGATGLAAARRALTRGEGQRPPVFFESEFATTAFDPFFRRAAERARGVSLAVRGADAEAWLRAAVARADLATNPPTELHFADELGVPNRAEYEPAFFRVSPERMTTSIAIRVRGELSREEAGDVMTSDKVTLVSGSWDFPFDPGCR